MEKCEICGAVLTEKRLGLGGIFSPAERKRLKKIRKKRGICSECSIQLLMLDILK